MKRFCYFLIVTFLSFLLFSCVSSRASEECSRVLSEPGIKSADQLTNFFLAKNPDADKKQVFRLAKYYVAECKTEGINSDCAFVQMCLETGFLTYGNLVTPDMNNFCGLGAIDAEHRGEYFATEELGVRAHVQHLHAYSTTEESVLHNDLIDRRYKYVKPRGKAPTVFELAGTWAGDKEYGSKLDSLLSQLAAY
ncbi:glucosaminidase domain-containing protein [Treponema zioleckii]|uniref:glucosaminidase domain-containing protein n=1 Tax=Treponema zioleckii TaxID=331680 RepID=UPI00168BFFF1|nr:glucosaminidase domain-containing protein [Treponema zioleckii]